MLTLARLLKAATITVVLVAICLVVLYVRLLRPEPPALQAFINANVLTMNGANDKAQAVLVERGNIIAVGSTPEISARVQTHHSRDDVVVHDLLGKTLMPGIIDAHSHFPGSGVTELAADLNAPPIGEIKSIEQMIGLLRKFDQEMEKGEWLFGLGYDDTQMLEGRHPMRQELDAVSTDRPIFILHISGHMGVANTKAFELLDVPIIHRNTSLSKASDIGDVDNVHAEQASAQTSHSAEKGEHVRNRSGQLTGLILESAVFPFLAAATDFSVPEIYQVVKAASEEYAAQGVTTVQNGAADKRYIVGLNWAVKLGLIPQRVVVWPMQDAMEEGALKALREQNRPLFEVGATKLIADGSIQGYTAYLSKPYHVAPKGVDGDYYGKPLISRESLHDSVLQYFSTEQQVAIHANGDASIDDVLFAVEQGVNAYPDYDHRTILIHAQMARPDQLEKMKSLGISPSFFSAHTYYWGDRHRRIFMGRDRANAMSPAQTASQLGLRFSIHLDTPVVPMQPMRLLWSAVHRKSSNGKVIGLRERLSRTQALRAITIDAAYQIFKEEQLGSIEIGKLADLVVLSKDPTQEQTDLLSVQVLSTYVGGLSVYQRGLLEK